MKNFAGKTAVITGAGSGMGRYLAVLLAKAGANVAICDINQDTLNATATMVKQYNVGLSTHVVDMGDMDQIEALPEAVIAQHGSVDLLFNNAGVTVGSTFDGMSERDWDWVMNINLNGVVKSSRVFLPYLKDRPEAVLVNTSSIFGMIAVAGQSVYHATKFGVRGFTESLAKEFKGTNLQVHCVHPGHVGTNILANSRFNTDQPGRFGEDFNKDEMAEMFRTKGMHPSRAASIILNGVRGNKRRIFVGLDAKLMDLAQRLTPMHYEWLLPLINLPLWLLRNKKPLKHMPAEPDSKPL
ncbi:MAG: SDR family NAD(P)-dependent oxidoreductase [Pseudomonadales bacterium]|jgi:NADP-dependent 3-hydroxy acid dehydrogenase YdfG